MSIIDCQLEYLKTSLDYLNGRIKTTIINCPENRYDKDEFRMSVRTFLHRRFVNAKNMRGKKHKLSLLRFFIRVTRRFSARRSFALEQLSTNTKSTQHQTAKWARDRVLFNRSSRICNIRMIGSKCIFVSRYQSSINTRVYVCEREY